MKRPAPPSSNTNEAPPQDARVDRRAFLQRVGLAATGLSVSLPAVRVEEAAASEGAQPAPVALPQVANPTDWTLAEAAEAIRGGQVSSMELVDACLARIRRHDGVLQAFNTVRSDDLRTEAAALDDAGHPRGLLHGVPLAIKDNFCTAGVPTTANSHIFADYVPDFDATTVTRLKDAGGLVLGKTQMGPLATSRATTPDGAVTTRNAWAPGDPDVSPGGSSSGSATSVAARMAFSSTGTQTGGSITSPSLAQGLTGLKPTMGRVSLHGIIPLTYTRDHPGPLARDAMDAAIMLQVMAGPDRRDHRSLGLPPVPNYIRSATVQRPGETRWPTTVGVLPGYLDEGDSDRTRNRAMARKAMLEELRTLGVQVRDVELPEGWETLTSRHLNNVRLPERSEPFIKYLKEDVRLFGVSLSPWINGLLLSGDEYLKGQRAKIALLERMLASFFQDCDLVAVPSHLPFDIVGLPLMAFPCGWDSSGGTRVPVGAMLAGPPFAEERLLSVVSAYQAVTEHHKARPDDPTEEHGQSFSPPPRLDTWEIDEFGA